MDFLFDTTDSPMSENASCSTQSSLGGTPPRGIEGLRRKLKLTTITSEKFSAFGRQPDSNDDMISAKGIKSSTFKKKFQDLYITLETIGKGACGIVKKVQCQENNEIYAAKIVKGRHQETIEQLKREYQILSKLQHKNIITAKELLLDEASGNAQLILEYFPGKTLEELIQEKGQLEEELVRHIVEQLVSALKHAHDKGVCHRDIKPDNILINEYYEVKLIDFSISKIFRQELWSPLPKTSALLRKKSSPLLPGYHNFMLTNIGTDYYKAPEVVTSVPYNNSVDMWSLGVVTFYCLVGYKPFQSKSVQKLYEKISNAEYKWDQVLWSNISYEATLFVKACLTQLPFVRLSTKEALYHPWTRGIKIEVPEEPRKDRRGRTKYMSPPARTMKRVQVVVNSQPRKSFVLGITSIN